MVSLGLFCFLGTMSFIVLLFLCHLSFFYFFVYIYCLNGTLPCIDFMDVIMGDIPYITTLCLNGTLPCIDFMDVIMGDIPYPHCV